MQFPALSPQPTRARNLALSVALLIVIGALLWSLVFNTLLEAWASLNNDHVIWHILGDVLFGLLVAVLAYRLVRQSVIRLETTEQVMARYARSITALYETSLEINAQPDTATLLNIILQRTCDLLGTNMGSVYLCSEHDDTIVLVASQPRQDVGTVLRLGEGLAGRVAQTGEPFTVYDYSHWPERAAGFDDSRFGRMLAVPLKLHEKIIGVLTIDDAQPGDFSEDDLRLATMFADQVVLALQNRQLLEQAQTDLLQRRQVEEALRASEERYRLLIENQGEGICYVDENEYLIFANPAANELFGLPPHELEGRNLQEFMDEAEFAVIRQQTAIRRAGQTSTYENRITRADG